MGAAVAIRTDIEAAELRRLARLGDDGRVSARLLGLANVLDGMSRAAAAQAAGMDRHTRLGKSRSSIGKERFRPARQTRRRQCFSGRVRTS